MEHDKKIAVLIDADNVSSKYITNILEELSKYGAPTYKRIYGDWTKPEMGSWQKVLLEHSIAPMQQFSNTTRKNATDIALVIDAMDILYAGKVDSFCIVSSDGDFTKLAARLREAGMYVIGMGEEKTPLPFKSACEVFKYLEVLAGDKIAGGALQEEAAVHGGIDSRTEIAHTDRIMQVIEKIVNEGSGEDGWIALSTVGNMIIKQHPDFDPRNYGFTKLSSFVGSLGKFDVKQEANISYIRIKEKPAPKPEVKNAAKAKAKTKTPSTAKKV